MRQIATLVLAALLVVGTVPALGAAGVAQHGTAAQYTTDLGGLEVTAGELQTDHDGTATNHTGARVTGYEIADRTLAGDEPLRLRVNGSGEGSTAVAMSVDGRHAELGTAKVDGERVVFEPNDDLGESIIEDIDCEGEFNSWDDWWIRCEITLDVYSVADGTHDVGVDGLEPTPVAVESANPGPFGPVDDLGDVLDLLFDGLFGG